MPSFARTDTSLVSVWWWEIDRWNLFALISLVIVGAVLMLAASPSVADRIGLDDDFHFVRRQFVFLLVGLMAMLTVSFMSSQGIRRLAIVITLVSVTLMIVTLFYGVEIKGARRWLYIGSLSIQPSEFVKPAFAVLAAWMFSLPKGSTVVPGYVVSTFCYLGVVALLLLQPDVGMTIVVSAVWGVQFFLAGMPIVFVVLLAGIFLAGSVGAYFTFDHVHSRVDEFFKSGDTVSYQVGQAMEAFRDGGLLGVGPGQGQVRVPDAHTDFILAVAGEEFGLIVCLIIVALFCFVVLRGFSRVFRDSSLFSLLAVGGLLVQFSMQAIINIASTTNLMPPKGITLPFISYGGSSTLGLALAMGMVLALTRTRGQVTRPFFRPMHASQLKAGQLKSTGKGIKHDSD